MVATDRFQFFDNLDSVDIRFWSNVMNAKKQFQFNSELDQNRRNKTVLRKNEELKQRIRCIVHNKNDKKCKYIVRILKNIAMVYCSVHVQQ